MSEPHRAAPAMGIWEFSSIAAGITVGDAIAKHAPVSAITTGTVHPGHYLVLVAGDLASVTVAADVVSDIASESLTDGLVLPDIDPSVADALLIKAGPVQTSGEAVGVVETATVPAAIEGADAAVKDSPVALAIIRLADGLGGKAYFVIDGTVGDVESSVAAAVDRCGERLVGATVIPQLTDGIRTDLGLSSEFGATVVDGGSS
ncbi:MAG: BMC domain-containing protein [Acidimicrobiia bacterium]